MASALWVASKQGKMRVFEENLTYRGNDIDKDGLRKSADKVEAVLKALRSNDLAKVRSFLGQISYYHRFLSNLPTAVDPLTQLLEKNQASSNTLRSQSGTIACL